jgi:type III secretory pathway component EscS
MLGLLLIALPYSLSTIKVARAIGVSVSLMSVTPIPERQHV